MLTFALKRLAGTLPVLLGVTLLVFGLLRLTPGDPLTALVGDELGGISATQLAQLRRQYGLDGPWYVQYGAFMEKLAGGDLVSLRTQRPVVEEIAARFPYTLQLTVVAVFLAALIAVPLGVIAALRRGSPADLLVMGLALLGVSVPTFWLGIMLMLAFALGLGWLPPSGSGGPEYFVLPTATLTFASVALIARMTRASLLETLDQDYVRTARAKGLRESRVVTRHALRSALVPIVTVIGLEFGALLSGAAVTETIFAWPGLGRLTVQAIASRDLPLIEGIVIFTAVLYTLVNLTVDLLYAALNPRIRLQYA
ncbi:ABC transporter permease [Deinococcus hopiensis]|uniref:Peptide/nickel transport system permease protein n=1 Tax=Deinococcus hopiensis KR-140 TaxID=695939 RepID=A0A1W1UR36_9DEIO|nr:ABC transporter permease [Deinococcus hopiensis]SMB83271.1 peptide/nickel transport system permease protein [Deinococcus hopiensis KR-140]